MGLSQTIETEGKEDKNEQVQAIRKSKFFSDEGLDES